MKDAKSMYRGGDIVEAKHCDFDSSRLLGLVCPFCNEAVYLRAGTSRIGKNKTVLVNPAFCHYPGSAEDLDCERRSISGEGREEIERIKAEKRGQRLELYNKHLWDMIESQQVLKKSKHVLNSLFGHERTRYAVLFLTRFLRDADFQAVVSKSLENNISNYKDASPVYDFVFESRYQMIICQEIIGFLWTRSAGHVFEKLVTVSFFKALDYYAIKRKNDLKCAIKESLINEQKFYGFLRGKSFLNEDSFLMNDVIDSFVCTLIRIPWEAQIERFSNPDRKAGDKKFFALIEAAKASKGI